MQKAVREFVDHYGALDALIARDAPPLVGPGDLTVRLVADRAGCNRQKAKAMILRWVDAGEAEYLGKRRDSRGQSVDAWKIKSPPASEGRKE